MHGSALPQGRHWALYSQRQRTPFPRKQSRSPRPGHNTGIYTRRVRWEVVRRPSIAVQCCPRPQQVRTLEEVRWPLKTRLSAVSREVHVNYLWHNSAADSRHKSHGVYRTPGSVRL